MAKNGGIKGVYDKDPNKYKDAKFIPRITYSELIEKKLEVIDLTSCTMAQENKIELVIFDINGVDNILKAALQHEIGTKVVG
jgi:uridylate kinase